jgi:hypothetical protein
MRIRTVAAERALLAAEDAARTTTVERCGKYSITRLDHGDRVGYMVSYDVGDYAGASFSSRDECVAWIHRHRAQRERDRAITAGQGVQTTLFD